MIGQLSDWMMMMMMMMMMDSGHCMDITDASV